MQYALVIGQIIVVVFLAFHDWVPLGKLVEYPDWLLWWLWGT
jgi:hypothetical protein